MIPDSEEERTTETYGYNGHAVRALRRSISPERLGTYLRLASGDRRRALHLYVSNAAIGSAFHGPLQTLEVSLRNAVNDTLALPHGELWFDNTDLLKGNESESISRAKAKIRRPLTPGRIVAELNFGFWVALFARRYEDPLWYRELHKLFRPTPKRIVLHDQLNRLRTLRNRIAHHEPILQRDLRVDHEKILWILEMLSPETAAWVAHHSRVVEVLETKPHLLTRF